MNHTPLKATPEQRENLRLLADRLEARAAEIVFDMGVFSEGDEGPEEVHICGTAGCIVGNAPALGFPAMRGEGWVVYSFRLFCPASGHWKWLFSGRWRHADNTLKGAVARIRYSLEHGVPDNWDDQMRGIAPLSYMEGQE